jgi:hypothetical protein
MTTTAETDTRSKLVLFFQNDANTQNDRPSMKGTVTLPQGASYSVALWSGQSEDGKGLYLTGQLTAQDVGEALKAKHAKTEVTAGQGIAPPGLDLTPGQIVLFETPKEQMAENAKRPNFYGYALTAEGYLRLAAWNRKTGAGAPMLAGTAEINQPRDQAAIEPATPQPRASRSRAPKPGQGTA